ncbi:MAG: TRIC cation channel family protein [Xanthomonadaceae bacterium]|nr:TRIC cation channel family protein [Xanthomonadaceae bacterium]
MNELGQLLPWLDIAGLSVFAVSGVLVAVRKHVDVVGACFFAIVTAVGGGTLRTSSSARRCSGWKTRPRSSSAWRWRSSHGWPPCAGGPSARWNGSMPLASRPTPSTARARP